MDYLQKIIGDFEIHSVEGINECFENGIDPNQLYKGKPLIYEMINMYLRSSKFKDCIKAFVDHGLQFEDKALLAVLLDDASLLDTFIIEDKELLLKKYSLDCTFTPLLKQPFSIFARSTIIYRVQKCLYNTEQTLMQKQEWIAMVSEGRHLYSTP